MADDDDEQEEGGEGEAAEEGEEGEGGAKGGKKKLLILIGVALLLVVGGAAAAYFTGLMDPLIEMVAGGGHKKADGGEEAAPATAVFHELPELLVNLNTGGRKSVFLKIRISLELEKAEDIPKIEGVMPRVIDNFQVYLRELRVEDLKGSEGMYRLREELLMRVSAAAAPAKVNDVLFKEMLVQ
ncbi:MAG: flagellar basal body protein FliL [Rhodospirillales bacterium RIFCSPLOWO2_12_FULL_58_28]|nr:MAG: flagellar basal body protein FliL [Rhodospirillales bacterium RIFCSPLOWO2_02_FULL_58_16]OHC79648.1 MAG: flagellar basal body protein FliL [Rhodospirillales bacterium RIFCSPLOWO2_12_FULL_58_28]